MRVIYSPETVSHTGKEPVMFLGEWCRLYSRKDIWKNISHEVVPYHWDDKDKLNKDYVYLEELNERVSEGLARALNLFHGANHSARYWRMITGIWLMYFTGILFDRYQCVLRASGMQKDLKAVVSKYKKGAWLVKDLREFQAVYTEDGYNKYLFDRIIERTNLLLFEVSEGFSEGVCYTEGIKTRTRPFEKIINAYQKVFLKWFHNIAIVEPSLKINDLIKLELALGQLPLIYSPQVYIDRREADWDRRNALKVFEPRNDFEKLLADFLREELPISYAEGYEEMNKKALRQYPKDPKVIFTSTAMYSNDAFNLWAAHYAERGAKLLIFQHGAVYGVGKCIAGESHEISVADKYFTWGWKDNNEKVVPIPAARLNFIKNKAKAANQGSLLMASVALPRYSHHIFSGTRGASGMAAYFDFQRRFVEKLDEESKRLLLIRLYQYDYEYDQMKRWRDVFPGLRYSDGTKHIIMELNKSRLFIGTYNTTIVHETFAANYPTIIFWDSREWQVRDDAEPYFRKLRDAGILYYSPEEAAKKVNEIRSDVSSWWSGRNVQEAKNEFNKVYAYTSENWIKEWARELKDAARGQ